jgi:hypothetical protein
LLPLLAGCVRITDGMGETTTDTNGDSSWRAFFSQAAEKAAGFLLGRPHGNYCGPGGAGAPVDLTDAACQTHDACYDTSAVGGVSRFVDSGPLTLTPEQELTAAACDAQFCEDLAKVQPQRLPEEVDNALIQALFRCAPMGPDRGSGPAR